jgi:hypothetical protein
MEHADGVPDQDGDEGVQDDVGEMEEPGAALGSRMEKVERPGDGEFAGKSQERKRLIEVSVDDGKKLYRVLERRPVHQDMVEGEAMIIAADKSAAQRGQTHDDGRQRDRADEDGWPGPMTRL